MKIWVVIPVYNEEKAIGEIIDVLKKKNLPVLVIDDGSNDNTPHIVKKKGGVLLQNKINRGKGESIKRGIDYLLKNESFDYIITMDGDGQHSPYDIDKFIKEAEKKEKFVVGNRMGNPSGMPKIRVLTNKIMSWFISKMVRQEIPDTQCGFRLISKDVLETINIETDKFQIESEIIIKAARCGVSIKSIPIKSIYHSRSTSKIDPILDTIRFIRFIFKLNNARR